MAKAEKMVDAKATYFFRIVPESNQKDVIESIAGMGHEIGYHYEDVDLVVQRKKLKVNVKNDEDTLIDAAYDSFCENLEMFRKDCDISIGFHQFKRTRCC